MPRYIVCWNCYQPQDICRVADPDHEESECRFPNMVIPICVAAYKRVGGVAWLERHFERTWEDLLAYMIWLGERTDLEGNEWVYGNKVAALILRELE